MAKEWILNQGMNRWGLNKKRCVGPVSELIRLCAPKTLEEWEEYYYHHAYSREHLDEVGRKLYIKISEVIQHEVADVTEQDCIEYIKTVVINRTYDGYLNEIETIYGQLEQAVSVPIRPAPDEWDRLYNVDFFIEGNGKYIGIQIKPVTFQHTFEEHKWKNMQETSHAKFAQKFGGRVFTVFSTKVGGKKVILNAEVIEQIKQEVRRLGGEVNE